MWTFIVHLLCLQYSYSNRFWIEYGGAARFRRDQEFDHKLEAIRLVYIYSIFMNVNFQEFWYLFSFQGLPNPMIVVAEYMESLDWERCLPSACYHARVCLYFSVALLSACAALFAAVPSHALRALAATGATMILSCAVFW